jgi:hypothetical protein
MFGSYALGFFSDRDNLQDAIEYANDVIFALPKEHRMAAMAALYVVINTAAKLEREPDAMDGGADRDKVISIYQVNQ